VGLQIILQQYLSCLMSYGQYNSTLYKAIRMTPKKYPVCDNVQSIKTFKLRTSSISVKNEQVIDEF